jgi:hypothetical protein
MSTLTDKLPKLPAVKLPEVDLAEVKKPAFAAAGVVDLTVEQVKELPAQAKKAYASTTADLTARIEAVRTESAAQLKAVPAQLKTLPTEATTRALALRSEVEARVAKAQTEATAYYAKLTTRGEKLVGQIRRQPATEAAIAEGKAAVKKAEQAAGSARKSAKSTEKAVEGAAAKLG